MVPDKAYFNYLIRELVENVRIQPLDGCAPITHITIEGIQDGAELQGI
jgi:hypothetical protein